MTPARRGIPGIGVPLVLAVIVIGAAGWASGAVTVFARQVSYRVAVNVPATGGHVSVTAGSADVNLGSGTGDLIRVRGTLRGSFVRPTFSWQSTAAGLALHAECRVPIGNCSLQYAITAPASFPIAVTDSSGNMNASGLRGTVTLSDGSGDLGVSGLAGNIRLDNSSGNITASGLTGGIRLGDSAGNITVCARPEVRPPVPGRIRQCGGQWSGRERRGRRQLVRQHHLDLHEDPGKGPGHRQLRQHHAGASARRDGLRCHPQQFFG